MLVAVPSSIPKDFIKSTAPSLDRLPVKKPITPSKAPRIPFNIVFIFPTVSLPKIPSSLSAIPLNAPKTNAGTPFNKLPIIGNRLPTKNVDTVCPNCSNEGWMSSPNANLPNKLVKAAFIDLNDPCNVEAASLAVVPVIPNSP